MKGYDQMRSVSVSVTRTSYLPPNACLFGTSEDEGDFYFLFCLMFGFCRYFLSNVSVGGEPVWRYFFFCDIKLDPTNLPRCFSNN